MTRLLSALALMLLPSPALACGGMFCDAVQPVDQAAERIVFAWAEDEECSDGLGDDCIPRAAHRSHVSSISAGTACRAFAYYACPNVKTEGK